MGTNGSRPRDGRPARGPRRRRRRGGWLTSGQGTGARRAAPRLMTPSPCRGGAADTAGGHWRRPTGQVSGAGAGRLSSHRQLVPSDSVSSSAPRPAAETGRSSRAAWDARRVRGATPRRYVLRQRAQLEADPSLWDHSEQLVFLPLLPGLPDELGSDNEVSGSVVSIPRSPRCNIPRAPVSEALRARRSPHLSCVPK